ncbi:glycoside hydrolase family 2 protein [Deinococcus peraridilitoris]|uniref:Beta-galactosidase/beta-glucuronidase n=1 Tax=Deinococcus peraridilitoris (strain DSM 19664 / LMG 22246 / CIP 109416 / KR-200) TaxID=937777 RepID=L0A0C8_DEIPD|nr:beta-galactosidase/beta-glucuronidase [Deinococcus peraridilitoris DSM 19664]
MKHLRDHHPRPQLTREQWQDLSGPWAFAFDDQNVGLRQRWFESPQHFDRQILVPFPPESHASGLRETGFHPVVWYRRTFQVGPAERSGRLLLHFGAVDYRARVWLNGRLVAEHEGGHTPFTADLSDALTDDGEQVLVVRAEDDPRDLAQPRGKQDWLLEPHAIWYHRTTGIWQTVWLECVPWTYLQHLRWTPNLNRMELHLQAQLNDAPAEPCDLRVRLTLRGQFLAEQVVRVIGRQVACTLSLQHLPVNPERDDLLWSPRRPNLIDAELSLLQNGSLLDQVASYAGMRSVAVKGGRFLLNGLSYYQRLVLAQNYWPQSHLAAPDPQALEREVRLVKDLGFNGVRIHQKIEDPRFLYWCDTLGLLVWGEMPSAYVFTEQMCERLTREWLEFIRRDYSHPCVVAWVPLNESWGVPDLEGDSAQRAFARGLYQLTKAFDPTRPVIANDGWQFVGGEMIGVHDYATQGATLRERYGTHEAMERTLQYVQPYFRNLLTHGEARADEAMILSEFGGLSFAPGADQAWFGYGTVTSSEGLLERYRELVTAVLHSEVLMGFCYTQLTDTEQETNGLLTAERQPKLDIDVLRAINTRSSQSMPGDVLKDIHHDAQARHDSRLK